MHCYWAKILKGELELLEAENACWLTAEELYSVDWLPADLEVVRTVEKALKGKETKE